MRRGCWALFLLLLPFAAHAQQAATLIADRVEVQGNTGLLADGHVEVLHDGVRLSAARIFYNRATDRLEIAGPIRIEDGDRILILADQAALDSDLENGILQSAKLVLDQQLQLAAAEMSRVGGRYTQMFKAVASSCMVCEKNPVPLWQIRASRVIHDQEERQLYFDNATVRVLGLPVFYLPRLRLPDPTLKRATGFLLPEFRTTSRLGTGIKVPYFIAIGDHQDLTLTPYLSSSTSTLEYRYRRKFRKGEIQIDGAFTRDDILSGNRGYIFAEGKFDFPRDYKLTFDIENTSDDAYLLDYGITEKDRLDSAIELSRTQRDSYLGAALVRYESLRADEDNNTLPSIVADLTYERRFVPNILGGTAGYRFEAHGHYRNSDLAIDGPDADTMVDGRDVARFSAEVDWRRSWVLGNGIEATTLAQLNADYYGISQDAALPDTVSRVAPFAAVELRWPWTKTGRTGAYHMIEPVVQLVYSDDTGPTVPQEDSTRVEFDEGNLFSLSRFPGADAYERGVRANLGVTWTRYDPAGWSLGLTLGRIVREGDLGQFNTGSGLDGSSSDWLAALQLDIAPSLTLTNRALFDDSFEFSKNETRLSWTAERFGVASSYIWMEAEAGVSALDTSEWALDGTYVFNRNWTGKFDWRYDFVADDAASAGIGLIYQNECIEVDLSLSRRFTSSTSVAPETNFSVSVALAGLGNSRSVHRERSACYG